MQEIELFKTFIRPLDQLDIHYMVTGSVASIIYGEPRLTHDIDIVLEISQGCLEEIPNSFNPTEFYCPPTEIITIENRRSLRGHFNIIHHETGYKADIYLVGDDAFNKWGLERRKKVELNNLDSIWIAPLEYVIVRKLQFFREGGSEKHIRDIQGMMEISGEMVNKDELIEWVDKFQLQNQWKQAIE